MRYAVISDIHGNLHAFEAVLRDAGLRGVDGYLFLGDYFLDMPYVNEVADRLRGLENARFIAGNKEGYFHAFSRDKSTWVYEQMNALYWAFETVTPENEAFYMGLPEEISFNFDGPLPEEISFNFGGPLSEEKCFTDGGYVRMFHNPARLFADTEVRRLGSGRFYRMMKKGFVSHEQFLAYADGLLSADGRLADILGGMPSGAYLFGHTHIQWHWNSGGTLILNPGSCGLPLGFDTRACYSVIEYGGGAWTAEEYQVEYPLSEAIRALRGSTLYACAPLWCDVVTDQLLSAEERVSMLVEEAERIGQNLGKFNASMNGFFTNEVFREAYRMYKQIDFKTH